MNGDTYSRGEGGRHSSSRDQQPSRSERGRDRGDRGDRGERGDRGDRDRGDRDRGDRDRGDRGDRGDRDRARRRSRSPDYRARGLRDAGIDADSYSSSRSHRDREREDRYSGRDRRDRDPWDRERDQTRDRDRDRDRGSRREPREPRRDDDDRHSQRDGAHDNRSRRRERNREHDRDWDRKRSPSPHKKREPTPDLTSVVPILERKRRLTQWDIKPSGYENVSAEQAKLSGMFPLPGAPRQQTMDPTKLQALIAQPTTTQANVAALKPTNARQSKRLLISNLPPSATDESLVSFFNLQLNGLNVIDGTDPCVHCQIAPNGSFAIVEFQNSSDATVALALDGIAMEAADENGAKDQGGLSIHRPKDYIVPGIVDYSGYQAGVVSNVVADTPNKISITNIPPYLSDEQVTELLVSFGELRAFVLVKDKSTEESRGIAFCEYAEPASTEIAIQGMNGMDLGDRKLKVTKASIGITQVAGAEMGVNAVSMLAGTAAQDSAEVSRVIQLLNMVTADELMDNEDYEEICEDVKDECNKFGTVTDIKVPRPSGNNRQSAGIGKIFVKFSDTGPATKALKALAGRKFSDRTVVATYFPEENFDVEAW